MNLVHRRKGVGAGAALAAFVSMLALSAASAPAASATCPSFRVLHNDRIGPASLPAGNYAVTPATGSGLTCAVTSRLFARFLADYDGALPTPWRVVAQGSGKATFQRGTRSGFSVALTSSGGGEGGSNPSIGQLCNGTFSVNNTTVVRSLRFARGRFLLYIPARSLVSCRAASALFTRFLAQPGGALPPPWRLLNQTATFYKPAHPQRSAFRVEPLNGAGTSSGATS